MLFRSLEARLGPLYPAVAALPTELRRGVLATQTLQLQVPTGTPLFDFTAADGIRHTLWRADEAGQPDA